MVSFIPSFVALGFVVLAAAIISSAVSPLEPRRASSALLIATAVQAVHFSEEWFTDFHIRFPGLFGLPPIPAALFVSFNLAWLVIWLACAGPLQRASRFARFAAWFLALAGLLNAVAHPAFALYVGGYFPGLWTAAFIGAAGAYLSLRLYR